MMLDRAPIRLVWTSMGGNACSEVKGHDHLVGLANTGGDFNIAWHVWLVVFTPQGVSNGKSNTRIATLNQMNALVASGDAVILPTPVTFSCASVAEATYAKGTPVVIQFP
jgi:hypothetical protein